MTLGPHGRQRNNKDIQRCLLLCTVAFLTIGIWGIPALRSTSDSFQRNEPSRAGPSAIAQSVDETEAGRARSDMQKSDSGLPDSSAIASDNDDWFEEWKSTIFTSINMRQEPWVTGDPPFVICLIHKNANTQFKALMLRSAGFPIHELLKEKEKKAIDIHSTFFNHQNIHRLSFYDDENAKALLTDPDVPRYAIVRNPLTRTLSAYRDKVERYHRWENVSEGFSEWVHRWYDGREPPRTSCEGWTEDINRHWVPQVCFCGFQSRPELFQQFKYEDMSGLFDELNKHISPEVLNDGWGLGYNVSFQESFKPVQKTKHAVGTEDSFYDYFTLETFDILAEKLEPDIRMFGYDSDIAEMRAELVRRKER